MCIPGYPFYHSVVGFEGSDKQRHVSVMSDEMAVSIICYKFAQKYKDVICLAITTYLLLQ